MIPHERLMALLAEADTAACDVIRGLPGSETELDLYELEVRRYLLAKLAIDDISFVRVLIQGFAHSEPLLYVRAWIPAWGIGAELRVGQFFRDRAKQLKKPFTGYPGGMAAAKLKLIDGLTPDECLSRYTLMQRDQAMVNSLTRMQLLCARALWGHDVRVAVKKTETEARERDRLQVVVDYEED